MLKREDILHQEKISLLLYMKYRKFLSVTQSAGKAKNAFDSETCRKKGNELYGRRPHNKIDHEEIFNLYTQSIALAPNNSEDLATGYGNRSALLFHVKRYKECIIDIDRALSVTSSNLLKVKLLCRKAESLMMLNKSTEDVCKEALQILEQLKESQKIVYAEKLNQLLVNKNVTIKSDTDELPENGTFISNLLNVECSAEIPIASKSVALEYNKKWGRHIVAVEDIKPGEIISVQDSNCFTVFANDLYYELYSLCSHCRISTFNSLPCEFCIFSIYCSEACRSEAWNEYHQYECIIYQHSIIYHNCITYVRFVLSVIYEVGSIEQMKEHILEIENTTDPRIKGFSNGIFHTEQKKNLYSLQKCSEERFLHSQQYALFENICNCVYLLANFTNFFGKRTSVLEQELLLDEDRLFIAALTLRTIYITSVNSERIREKEGEPRPFLLYVNLFSNLINHSCFGNVRSLIKNNGKNMIIALQPIRKGSQLFKCYDDIHFRLNKKERQDLLKAFEITCECIACTENWSTISVPSIEQLVEITPTLDASIVETNKILLKQIDSKYGDSRFTPKLYNQVCHHLAKLAENFTGVCEDYFLFLQFLNNFIFHEFSGNLVKMPQTCE